MRPVTPNEAAPRAQEAYQVQLAHLDVCPRCRADEPCEDGMRIRRALRAARTTAAAPHNSRRDNGGM